VIEKILNQVLPYSTSTDPRYLVVILIVIGIITVAAIINRQQEAGKKKRSQSRSILGEVAKNNLVFVKNRKFKQEIREITSLCSLDKNQSEFLSSLCATNHVEHPLQILKNTKFLEEIFSRAFQKLEIPSQKTKETELHKTILFTLREALAKVQKSEKGISSTRSLDNGWTLTIVTPQDEQYETTLLENTSKGMICPVPRDAFSNELRLPLWTKVGLFFSIHTGQSYRCDARIIHYESSPGQTILMLSHTDSLKPLPNRQHNRKAFSCDCSITPVSVANIVNGKHTEHRFYPSGKDNPGTMNDISAGGCSIISPYTPAQNQYIQIQCSLDSKNADSMIGKVVRISSGDSEANAILHIQFAKMPRATMNRIFALIFNYGELHK